jgi:Tfp pilus assembly protein PilE
MNPLARRGVTLIELMIALAITMIMMTAVITLFANVTGTLANGRALVEISERLRSARNRLQLDLAGHTATTIPPLRPEDGEGYLEIQEGPNSDAGANLVDTILIDSTLLATNTNNITGDADDVLMLTVRSQGEPFVGNMNGSLVESPTAEVIWFAVPNGRSLPADPDPPATSAGTTPVEYNTNPLYYHPDGVVPVAPVQLYTLYRRVLLINPTYYNSAFSQGNSNPPATVQQTYDLPVYPMYQSTGATTGPIVTGSLPNTLATLTARENRYYHQASTASGAVISTGFPFPANTAAAPLSQSVFATVNPSRAGEDVVLTDVLSFDIRIFDPLAPLAASALDAEVLAPGDPGYIVPTTPVGYGAYVDLNYNNSLYTFFSGGSNAAANAVPAPISGFTNAANLLSQTYDTWSLGYDQNGVDEDGNGVVDQGTDGLDNDPVGTPNGIVDDPPQVSVNYHVSPPTATVISVGERETLAPYPYPLRGVQITLRVYEPDTRQVREMTVVQDFLPD